MKWSSASLCHAGVVREMNEDACLDLPDAGVWVVADGMGGHEEGALASRLIVESLAQVGQYSRLSKLVDEVEDRLRAVHVELVERAVEQSVVGSTVAALVVMQHYSVCLWVGDSRVYRFREGVLTQLTQDHSYVEELIEHGRLAREEAEMHPDANVITRAVGAGEELYLDARLEEVRPADLYLICSDGLYREVCEQEIAEQMVSADCRRICDRLVNLALERGAQDNVTVVSVAIDDDTCSTS
ncbi:MAG: protein phosphatase 2C domain-containing protein [Candidatus Thiodiazotropha sp.]|jgi:serine/threonine protein phosphatase PrpC